MDLPLIKQLIRRERDRQKKERGRKVSLLATSVWCIKTALCIAVMQQGDFTAAAEWLASPHRRGKQLDDSSDHETIKAELKKLLDEVPPSEVSIWTDPVSSPLPRSCLETALKWSQGYKLKEHVRRANVNCGAPVRSVRLVEHYNAQLNEDGLESRLPAVAPVDNSTPRTWCHRWRIRHGASVGCLRTREWVPLSEKRAQALFGAGANQTLVEGLWKRILKAAAVRQTRLFKGLKNLWKGMGK